MKKIVPTLLTLCVILSAYADNYKIIEMNTKTIKIGNRICKKGDVFSDGSVIVWSKEKQALKAQNIETKEIVLFAEPAFRAKKSMTIKEYYIKTNHLSTREGPSTLDELSKQLNGSFYLLDTIRIDSPIPLDNTCSYYIRYETDDKTIEKQLPANRKQFMIIRSDFDWGATMGDLNFKVFFRSKQITEDYMLTDSMTVNFLPLCIEYE